jgi:hypothetical protein
MDAFRIHLVGSRRPDTAVFLPIGAHAGARGISHGVAFIGRSLTSCSIPVRCTDHRRTANGFTNAPGVIAGRCGLLPEVSGRFAACGNPRHTTERGFSAGSARHNHRDAVVNCHSGLIVSRVIGHQ